MERCNPTTACSVEAEVVGCTSICREHIELEFVLPRLPASEPGQFVQLLCRASDDAPASLRDWPADGFPSVAQPDQTAETAYLRRPFSIADRWTGRDGMVHLSVISRTVGAGTRWLQHLRPGDRLNLTGPLGRGFQIPSDDQPLILIGGGVGIPPLLYLARRLHELGRRDVLTVFGATTRALLPLRLTGEPATDGTPRPCVELPGGEPYPSLITSDDGSVGLLGVVTDGLRRWHESRNEPARPATVFACGPEAMLRAVARCTRQWNLACQLCIERNMGCGLGTCLSCVVRSRDAAHPADCRWALTCTDGPVFPRDDLLDYDDEAGA